MPAAQASDIICKLAKKGTMPSQIGVMLRDVHGVGQVSTVTGTKILRILRKQARRPAAFLPATWHGSCMAAEGWDGAAMRCRRAMRSKVLPCFLLRTHEIPLRREALVSGTSLCPRTPRDAAPGSAGPRA